MTTKELYNDVAGMGFERGFADESLFYTAANRALDTLNARFPQEATVTVVHRPPSVVLGCRQLHHTGGVDCRLEAEGVRAFSLLGACGAQVQVFADGRLYTRRTFSDSRVLTPFYGLLPAVCHCEILLTGVGDYTVKDVLMLGEAEQNACRDAILHTDCVEYRLTELQPLALSLTAPPEREAAEGDVTAYKPLCEGRDYRLLSPTSLALPNTATGTYRLHLRLSHERLTADSTQPSLREDAMHLLPTLTAAYAWLDLDKDKAHFYLNLYREAAAYRQTAAVADTGAEYGDVNGW